MSTRTGTLRYEFQAGVLAFTYLRDAENYAKALGLDTDLYYSGWLIRHDWLVVRGQEPELRRLGRYLDAMQEAVGSGSA